MSEMHPIEKLRDFTLGENLDAMALMYKGEKYTYGDLELMSRHISTWFTAMELKGHPVAFMLPNGFELMAVYLACLKTGAIAMPLSRKYSAKELERVLIQSEAKALIVELDKIAVAEDVDFTKTQVKTAFHNGVVPREGFNNFYTLLGPAGQYQPIAVDPSDPAVIFYTSAADQPKGVVHTYSSIHGALRSTSIALGNIDKNDRILVYDPQFQISGFIETFSGLLYGAYISLFDTYASHECVPALVN
ncbi:MAG: class I adenylate-forming enzyme family protein, partial [Thermodesulfobacteriota bacterium]